MTLAAVSLIASLLALEGATEPVRLVPFQCDGVSDGDVRGPLRVELRGQLLDDQAPTPPAAAIVAATCDTSDLLLSLAIPGRPSPPVRRVALGALRPDTRPRAVALAIAELLRRAPPAQADNDDDEKPPASPLAPPPPPGSPRNSSLYFAAHWLKLPHDLDAFVFGAGWGWTVREHWFVRQGWGIGALTSVDGMGRDDLGMSIDSQIGRSFLLQKKQRLVLSWAPVAAVQVGWFHQDRDTTSTPETTFVVGPAAGASLLMDRDDPCDGTAPRHGSGMALQILYVHWIGDVADRGIGWRGWGFTANLSIGLAY